MKLSSLFLQVAIVSFGILSTNFFPSTVFGDDDSANQGDRTPQSINAPAAPGQNSEPQVFTQEYQDEINTNKQAEDAQDEVDRIRHQRLLDFYSRQH